MNNPVMKALGGAGSMLGGGPRMPGPMGMMQQFMQFRQSFQGDPRVEVERMLQSGQISQEQFNQVQQQARQFMQLLGR